MTYEFFCVQSCTGMIIFRHNTVLLYFLSRWIPSVSRNILQIPIRGETHLIHLSIVGPHSFFSLPHMRKKGLARTKIIHRPRKEDISRKACPERNRRSAKGARCHFDRREKSFSDPSHSLGMTDLRPSLCVLGVSARKQSCAPVPNRGEPSRLPRRTLQAMIHN
jgi:hypothetical protein